MTADKARITELEAELKAIASEKVVASAPKKVQGA
jgi:hypothetical protein